MESDDYLEELKQCYWKQGFADEMVIYFNEFLELILIADSCCHGKTRCEE